MAEKLEVSQVGSEITPVKSGSKSSTFFVSVAGIIATSLPGILTYLTAYAEKNADKIPDSSWLSFALPVFIAVGYQFSRYLTTNGERQAQAQVATAKASVEVAKVTASEPSKVERISEKIDELQEFYAFLKQDTKLSKAIKDGSLWESQKLNNTPLPPNADPIEDFADVSDKGEG